MALWYGLTFFLRIDMVQNLPLASWRKPRDLGERHDHPSTTIQILLISLLDLIKETSSKDKRESYSPEVHGQSSVEVVTDSTPAELHAPLAFT